MEEIFNSPTIDFLINEDIVVTIQSNQLKRYEYAELTIINKTNSILKIPINGGKFVDGLVSGKWESVYVSKPDNDHYDRSLPYIKILPLESKIIMIRLMMTDSQVARYQEYRFGIKANVIINNTKYRWGNYSKSFTVIK